MRNLDQVYPSLPLSFDKVHAYFRSKGIIKRAGSLEAKGDLPRIVKLDRGADDNLAVRPIMARVTKNGRT